jgi:hypothetical protein
MITSLACVHLRELDQGRFPGPYLTITERAYAFVSSPSVGLFMLGIDGGLSVAGEEERELVRGSLSGSNPTGRSSCRASSAAGLRPSTNTLRLDGRTG